MYGMYLFKSVKSNKGDTVMASPLAQYNIYAIDPRIPLKSHEHHREKRDRILFRQW